VGIRGRIIPHYSVIVGQFQEGRLQRLFSTFPGGWPGFGLMLLRIALGFVAGAEGIASLRGHPDAGLIAWVIGSLSILSGVMMIVGFLTPFAGVVVGACGGVPLLYWNNFEANSFVTWRYGILVLVVAISLVLLGPGAFSLDARLFGRREIVIPRSSGRPAP